MRAASRAVALMLFCFLSRVYAEGSLPPQIEFAPPSGKGRALVLVSGHSGTGNYEYYAKDLAEKSYYVVLVDGKDLWKKNGKELLRGVITRAQQSPHALPGKVAVIGFSLGGGVSLSFAARMPELVSAVVVSYPMTSYIKDAGVFVSKIKVPTLMFAGVHDTYKDCCLIDTARKLAAAAKVAGDKAMLEVVEFPYAEHGWTIKGMRAYRYDDTQEGFRRTLEFLGRNSGA